MKNTQDFLCNNDALSVSQQFVSDNVRTKPRELLKLCFRGPTQRFIFHTQKIPTSEFVYPKNLYNFWHTQKVTRTSSKLRLSYC